MSKHKDALARAGDWDILPMPTEKHDLPKSRGMVKEVICEFPSMQLFIGASNSGKSTLLCRMCVNPQLMGGFFDEIYLISPTAKVDDLVKHLNLPADRVWDDLQAAVGKLEALMDRQTRDIAKEGIKAVAKNRKVLVVCDDCIGDPHFMKSSILNKLAIHGRHSLMSSIVCTQSYTGVPRRMRLQAQGLALFPSNEDEVTIVARDHCPPGLTLQEFRVIVNFATDERFSFLYINNHASDPKERYRKKLGTIIEVVPASLRDIE